MKKIRPSVAILDTDIEPPQYQSATFRFLSRWLPEILDPVLHLYWYATDPSYRLAIQLDRIFRRHTDRVDLLPESSGERGFVLSLDRQAALYFVQDGDRFFYEGWSLAAPGEEYEAGSPLISDTLRDAHEAIAAEEASSPVGGPIDKDASVGA